MKYVFIDTEFTGEHAHTTLVSIGVATLEGELFYATLNDFDQAQVTEWLSANVLNMIDPTSSISSAECYRRLSSWLEKYAGGEPICVVSSGGNADIILLFELWKNAFPEARYFHALHHLPAYLNHAGHIALTSLMAVVGLDPSTRLTSLLKDLPEGERHHAGFDAMVVRGCFLQFLRDYPELHKLKEACQQLP